MYRNTSSVEYSSGVIHSFGMDSPRDSTVASSNSFRYYFVTGKKVLKSAHLSVPSLNIYLSSEQQSYFLGAQISGICGVGYFAPMDTFKIFNTLY